MGITAAIIFIALVGIGGVYLLSTIENHQEVIESAKDEK